MSSHFPGRRFPDVSHPDNDIDDPARLAGPSNYVYPVEDPNSAFNPFLEQSDSSKAHSAGSGATFNFTPGRPAPLSIPSSSSAASPADSSSTASSSRHQSYTTTAAAADDASFDPYDASASVSKKPRIQLAPDQPLTAHGKPRERVYVACVQCRNRKVRCDGGKPECFNCSRRADFSMGPCSYDAAPRRRGKDRTPGSRKLAPYIPKKTRTTRSRLEEEAKKKKVEGVEQESRPRLGSYRRTARQSVHTDSWDSPGIAASNVPFGFTLDSMLFQPSDLLLAPDFSRPTSSVYTEESERGEDEESTIATEPSLQFTRETWWDALLAVYAAPLDRPQDVPILTVEVRKSAAERIAADLRFLFQVSIHWFSFINIPRFFSSLFNPAMRQFIQPSLILGMLGIATFHQSSEVELGAKGREKALRLIDQAHAAFNASVNSGWIDVGLVQAAWILAAFEINAHPKNMAYRTMEAMAMLDSLIRCLSLTTLDVDDPRASVFVPHAVPVVASDAFPIAPIHRSVAGDTLSYPRTAGSAAVGAGAGVTVRGIVPSASPSPEKWQCGCQAYSLQYHWPLVQDLAPQWAHMPMWPINVSEGEIQKEECRRLVWAAVTLTATHNTKTTAGTDWEPQHLWIKDPSNYALLFPGENLTPPGTVSCASSKNSTWALYMRTLLLWHSSLRMRCDMSLSDADRARCAMSAWLEIDTIETMLNRHTCTVEAGFVVQLREILFNTRMCVSHEFQRYIPEATTAPGQLFYHDKAERFLSYQLNVARYFARRLRDPSVHANDHTRRNFLVFWFMSQITRSISLWNADHTLMVALEVARNCVVAAEHLMLLWPSPGQRKEYEQLRERLVRTCIIAGVPPPERVLPLSPTGLTPSL